jgi:hypothetical protein
MMAPELREKICRPKRRICRLIPFVSGAPSGPIGRLLHGFNGEHAESYRNAIANGHRVDPPGSLTRHVLEMRSLAPDDRPERNQTAIGAARRRRCRRCRSTRRPG